MNILELLKDQVTGQLAGQASKFLGESESSVSDGLGSVFSSLLGKTIEAADDDTRGGQLLDMLKGFDGDSLGNIAGIFSGGSSGAARLMNQGSGILNLLFGNKTTGFIDIISNLTGMKGSSSSSLIKMAAPFLIKTIGKKVMSDGLGLDGLRSLLGGQKSHVQSSLPKALASSLGLGFLGDSVSKVTGAVSGATGKAADTVSGAAKSTVDTGKKVVDGIGNAAGSTVEAVKPGGSIWKYLIPALIALLALGFLGRMGCSNSVTDAANSVIDKSTEVVGDVAEGAGDVVKKGAGVVGDVAEGAGEMVKDGVDAVGSAVKWTAGELGNVFTNVNEAGKAALDKVSFASNSVGDQMMKFINGGFKGDPTFRFSNLTFETGSAKIQGDTGSEVDNMASILKAYPDLKIVVNGYTDNTGDASKNISLSTMRANAVVARMMTKGINRARISAKGYGAANPTASNNTEEGRSQNRRVEIQFVK